MADSVNYQTFGVTQEDVAGAKKSAKSRSRSVCLIAVVVVVSLLAITAAIGIGVGVSHTRSRSDQPSPSGLSSDTTVTQEQLQGEYYGTEGGIRFSSTVNATYVVLSITTTSGENIVYIVHQLASNVTTMRVNNTDFLLMERDDQDQIYYDEYVVPRDAKSLMETIMSGNGKMTDDVLQMLDNRTVIKTRQSVLYNVAMSYEATLIVNATEALGNRKIMGMDSPSVMNFYQFALRLSNAREISGAAEYKAKDSFTSDSKGYYHQQKRGVPCKTDATCSTDRCPSKKYNNDCFGMCGPGCWCWKFVCGDCCMHQYCYTHDQCCHKVGFFTLTCFSVAVRRPFARCTDTFSC